MYKELNSLELTTIAGGASGDFAELHGYVTGLTLKSFANLFIPYSVYKFCASFT
jgi:hypothetical protein